MKVKKLLSIVTAMAMLLGMMSFTTFAAGEVMVSDAAGLIEAAKTGGDITLEDDITLTEPLVLEASTVLDLNGHSITSTAAGAYDSAIRMKNSSDALTIKDSGNGGSISGVGEYLINDGAVTIEGGNLMLNPSDNVTAAAYGVYATAGFSMTGGSIEVNFLQANRLAYGVSSRGGSVTITGDASIKASATSGTISLEATGDTTKGYTALISGNASLQGRVALSSFPTATFEGDISIVVPSCSSGDYTYAIQLSRTNCTINGGYFEAQDRHFFSAGGGSEIVNQNDFIINDGTFYLNSTDSWTVGTFYDYVPVINGGVFKTDTDALYFAASWSVYKNIQFNGGYFEKPFKASSTADANTPKAICPTGYGFSTDTLAALTGNTSEYADYYWITKTSQIEANVNNSDVTDNNSVTTTVTGYTTYAEGSMSATSGGDSYTFYSDAAPYREGYTFRGWATSDTAMTGDQQLSGLTSADWTVYAVWEDGESTYDIVYDANGGSGTAPTTESEKETSEEITIPSGDSLNKANYIFAGWAIEPEATAATYSADDTVSVASIAKYAKLQDDKQVVTLYAVWESKVVIPEDTFSDQYYDYTGSPIAYVLEPVSINGETLEDFQITYYRDSSCTEELEEPPTDVGNYYGIMITRPEDDTYASFSQIVYLNIRGKRIRVSSSDYTGTYDGQPHTISVTVREPAEGYTIKYGTNRTECVLDEPPTYTDPCSYQHIYYEITAAGYTTYTGYSSVTIDRKPKPTLQDIYLEYSASTTGTQTAVIYDFPADANPTNTQVNKNAIQDENGIIDVEATPYFTTTGGTVDFVLNGGTAGQTATLTGWAYSKYYESTTYTIHITLNDKAEQVAPAAFNIVFTELEDVLTATIPAVEGAEYSFDGLTWSDVNTKTGIQPGESVTGYIRMKATETANASAVTSSTNIAPMLITDNVGVVFTPVEGTNNQYTITLKSLDADEIINRYMTADLAFQNESTGVSYDIEPADGMTASVVSVKDNSTEYRFSMSGFDQPDVTGEEVVIGTITFYGYGDVRFSVDEAYESEHSVNIVNTAKNNDNIVDNYTLTGGSANAGVLVVNDGFTAGQLTDDETGIIITSIAPATNTLTVNVTFPNNISDNAAAYQDMKATISGGDLAEDIVVNFGSDDVALVDNAYTFTQELTENTTYTVTISGAGYRTARYSVNMAEDKILTFWNNVMDEAQVIETGKTTGAVTTNFLAGDIVADNNINIYDLSAVVSYFGTINVTDAASQYAKYDLNRDGVIDSKDVALVLVSWGN